MLLVNFLPADSCKIRSNEAHEIKRLQILYRQDNGNIKAQTMEFRCTILYMTDRADSKRYRLHCRGRFDGFFLLCLIHNRIFFTCRLFHSTLCVWCNPFFVRSIAYVIWSFYFRFTVTIYYDLSHSTGSVQSRTSDYRGIVTYLRFTS